MSLSLLLAYLLVNWTPALLRELGLPLREAIRGTVCLNLGGIAGSLLISWLMDRSRAKIGLMVAGYAIVAVFVAITGSLAASPALLLGCIVILGFFLIGNQMSLTTYIAAYYPAPLRATGLGWTQAMGRMGSLVGPLAAGLLLTSGVRIPELFQFCALPALGVTAALYILARLERGTA